MDNPGEILRLCRLCLVKDQVNIPIFEEQGDIRQIFLKISSCLPVKVSRDDKLPKKICDGCSNKLDLLYEFWNTSANAEKTLLSWLGQAGVKDADETISAVAQQIAKPAETQVKQEALEDGHATSQVQDNFGVQSFDEDAKDESEAPPPKRARRTAAVKAQINITPESDDDDDMDSAEAMTKVEDESDESDGEEKDPSYSEVPGTSADDQAGPSGVGKDGVEAPYSKIFFNSEENNEEIFLEDGEKILIHLIEDESEYFEVKEDILKQLNLEYLEDKSSDNVEYKQENFENPKPKIVEKLIKKYPCNTCGGYFRFLRRHLYTHGPYNCMNCQLNFQTAELLDDHLITAHNKDKESYTCDVCSLGFCSSTNLALHKFEHTKQYTCPICNFTVKGKYRNSIINHIKRHEGQYAIKCDICGQGFVEKSFLTTHMEIHEAIPKYECEICNKKFTVKRYLDVHKSYNHKKELYGIEEMYQCEVCGRSFTFEKSLVRHLSCIHKIGEDRTVECPVCHKIIANNTNLKKHMRVHTGEKRFCCDLCGKAFSEKKYLKKHQNVHLKERVRKVRKVIEVENYKNEDSSSTGFVEEDDQTELNGQSVEYIIDGYEVDDDVQEGTFYFTVD